MNKDNPVPSIDKYTKIKYQTTFHKNLKGCLLHPEKLLNCEIFIPNVILEDNYKITKYIESNTKHFVLNLQNGVETNKEQPKKFKCRRGYDGCEHYEVDSICRCK